MRLILFHLLNVSQDPELGVLPASVDRGQAKVKPESTPQASGITRIRYCKRSRYRNQVLQEFLRRNQSIEAQLALLKGLSVADLVI